MAAGCRRPLCQNISRDPLLCPVMGARTRRLHGDRPHWEIKNALHWQLDVSFREGAARNRKDNGPANIAILRRRALDLARRDVSKGSLSIKLKRAGWDDAFLLSLINQLTQP